MRKRKAKTKEAQAEQAATEVAETSGIDALAAQLATYLPPEQIERVRGAYAVGAHAHASQKRKSGEPYITHPLAVAMILAGLRLDAETIIAAILHDTLEDTGMTRVQLEASFGPVVTELVDGVTKLERVDFASRLEADAESFRKMLLAMARDLRVILIKLADRLHNMRTLSAMPPDARRRIARETLDIYAPIAARLGMNAIRAELQDLGFRSLYPDRYKIIASRIKRTLGNRRESMEKIEHALAQRLAS
ncbi:MAG: bifunctional (p)ppGpp synthetase/guanosine-3',5'-bis(diphosphate) 3'-pyrophosphohydrolase, partial [Rhodanobacteraceae bacterium]